MQLVFHINGVFSYFVDIAIISFPVFAMAALGFIRAATIIQTGEVFVVKTALAISCAIPVLGCAAIGIIGSNVGALSQSVVRSPRIEERLLVPYKDTSTVEIVFVANRNEAFNFARSPIRRLAEDYTVRALFEDRLFFNRVTPVERDVGDVEAVVVFAGSASVSLVSEMKQNAVIGVLTDRSYVIVPRNIISMKNLVALSSQCSSKVVFFVEDVNRSVFAVNAGVAVLLSSPVKSPAEFHDICATWIARKLRSRLI